MAGFDASPATVQGIKDGYINLVIDQQQYLQGFVAVEQLCLTKQVRLQRPVREHRRRLHRQVERRRHRPARRAADPVVADGPASGATRPASAQALAGRAERWSAGRRLPPRSCPPRASRHLEVVRRRPRPRATSTSGWAGRGRRPARRQRGGQVDAHQDHHRRPPARRGRGPVRRRARRGAHRPEGARAGRGDRLPGAGPGRAAAALAEHLHGPRDQRPARLPQGRRDAPGDRGAHGRVDGLHVRCPDAGHERDRPVGWRAPGPGDRSGAPLRGRHHHPRRADDGPVAQGDREAPPLRRGHPGSRASRRSSSTTTSSTSTRWPTGSWSSTEGRSPASSRPRAIRSRSSWTSCARSPSDGAYTEAERYRAPDRRRSERRSRRRRCVSASPATAVRERPRSLSQASPPPGRRRSASPPRSCCSGSCSSSSPRGRSSTIGSTSRSRRRRRTSRSWPCR